MASDSDSDEDFVTYGTPLEPLEEDEPLKKPVPLHEQTVKDEKGRYKRFHGAFTGGFSAGYFNTVGSKEGWTPASFVSSRQQKAEKHHTRPEDFMDEEDFSEHGIAPNEITTSLEFSSSRRDEAAEKARAVGAQAAPIPGDMLLEELITPARSSVGVELLRRMGWKDGQGVGPRVKRKARRQQAEGGVKVYGCLLPPAGSEGSEDDDDDEFAPENVTFAPKDVTPVDFSPRLGLQGLGYCGLDPSLALQGRGAPEHIDLFKPQSETRNRLFGDTQGGSRRGGVVGQAFGVGALEDDDEDVYVRDSMSRYDTVLGEEEPGDGLYGWTAPQQYTRKKDRSRDASYIGKILEGFTLAQKPPEEKTIFPPPSLPRDYRPIHHFRPSVNISHLSGVSPALAEALRVSKGHMVKEEPQQGGRHQLDSGQRRALLGEDVLQGPSSVMELLRPEDRQRLLSFRNSSNPPSAKPSTPVSSEASQPAVLTSGTSAGVPPPSSGLQQQQEALAAWRGIHTSTQTFRPFEKNPSKQARYELYLSRLKLGDKDALEQSLDSGMTEWERSREREEFVRASILYRPTSSSLSSRFTRAKHQEDDDTVEVSQDQEGDVDDKQAAVKMKMFGKLTRETFEWHPDKLLCKRFNVPDPYPGSGLLGLPKVKRDKFSVFNFLTVTESREAAAPPKPPEPGKKSRWDVSEQKDDPLSELLSAARNQTETKAEPAPGPASPASISTSGQTPGSKPEMKSADQLTSDQKKDGDEEEEEESRPPMDLFKAIFASSSEEKSSSSSERDSNDEEDGKDTKDDEGKMDSEPLNLFSIPSTSITSSSSCATTTTSHQQTAVSSQSSTQEEEEFGPKLPPPSAALTRGGATSICSPSEEEKPGRSKEKKHKNRKQHKHKKEKKKKKHKKHKHKGKQQKKSKKEESGSSSEDSDEDGEERQVSMELLKRLQSVRSHQTR
ncbi:G patch domain-containing protein 1 isoform X2 [Archocentrus centrarchus]|uniref:G patch domain-containing protein 1 isoform X2 n=1 Tax=Archocentrus centrarchus TaxID=63155 RepID=UPI0011EA4889|nr:G patch domain-containing protein 1 isoform X2 [Archocentrus centrarchus]